MIWFYLHAPTDAIAEYPVKHNAPKLMEHLQDDYVKSHRETMYGQAKAFIRLADSKYPAVKEFAELVRKKPSVSAFLRHGRADLALKIVRCGQGSNAR